MRMDKLTSKFQTALADAQSLALGKDHQFIEPVHLMLALLDQEGGSIKPFLQQVGIQVNALRADLRSAVRDALETHLRHEPEKTSKSRIKKLRGLSRPQYRLRVDEIRVFYDVTGDSVEILAIVPKSAAGDWLNQAGEPDETGSTD